MFDQVKRPSRAPRIVAAVLAAAVVLGGGAYLGSLVQDDVAFLDGETGF